MKCADNVVADRGRSSGSYSDKRYSSDLVTDCVEFTICRTEVVTPEKEIFL